MYVFSPAFFIMLRRSLAAVFLVGSATLLLNTSLAAQGNEDLPDAVAIFNQAQDLHEKGDLAGAIKLYEKALKIEPAFPEAEYQRGVAELGLGKNTEAERSFRRALELRADWTLAMTGLGSLLVEKGQLAEAEKLLAKVVELEPHNPAALIAMTDLRLKNNAPSGVLQEILSRLTVLTGKANATSSLWTARAAIENALARRNLAKSSLAKALAADPKNRPALFLLADIAIVEGDIVKAKDLSARLDTASPANDSLKLLKANIFAIEGKTDSALAQLDSMQSVAGAANELRQKINTSRVTSPAELERQLAANEKDASILGRLCTLYRKQDPAKALDYCRKAADAEPGNANHAVGFGAALVQAKQYDSAVGIFRKILEIVPDNATARANLATALFQLKRFPEAKTEFQWLTEAQPKSAGPFLFLGILHDESAEYTDAMANYQQYLRLADPVENKLDIEKVKLRLPSLQRLIKDGKGKK
jgi:tetratricopeptide (TPR) repeat protein